MKSVMFNLHDVVLLFTFFQCMLFAVFLITLKKGKKMSNYLLSAFIFSQAIIPLDNLINFGEAFNAIAIEVSPNLMYTCGLAFWLEAPLMLLYIRSLVYKKFQLRKSDLWFFVPFLTYLVYFTDGWLLLDSEIQMEMIKNSQQANAQPIDQLIYIFRELFRFAFGVLCLIEVQKYQSALKQQVAETETVDLTWLKVLVFGFLILRLSSVLVALSIIFYEGNGVFFVHEMIGITSNYIAMLIVSGLIFFSAGFSPVFRGIDLDIEKPANSLKKTINTDIVDRILNYMSQNKPYLNPLLTLDNLASQVEIAPRALSNIINHHCNKNFFEFINAYRVKECKKLLTSESHKSTTMLDIMDLAGFNSKATFNTLFKKSVGVTPTQFRKQYWSECQKVGSIESPFN